MLVSSFHLSIHLNGKFVASCISNEATTLEDGLEVSEGDRMSEIKFVQLSNKVREIKDVGWKTRMKLLRPTDCDSCSY